MSRLVIAVGFADRHSATPPELVYLGRDASAMRAACDASPLPFLTLMPFAMGIPKANRNAAANAAARAASDARLDAKLKEIDAGIKEQVEAREQFLADLTRAFVDVRAERDASRAELEQGVAQIATLRGELDAARAELARVTAPPPEARHSPQGDGGPAAPAVAVEAPPPADLPGAEPKPRGKRS